MIGGTCAGVVDRSTQLFAEFFERPLLQGGYHRRL